MSFTMTGHDVWVVARVVIPLAIGFVLGFVVALGQMRPFR